MKRQLAATGLTLLLAASAVNCSSEGPRRISREPSTEDILNNRLRRNFAKRISEKLRTLGLQRDGMQLPITEHEEKVLADVLAYHYSKRKNGEGRQFGAPENFEEDLAILSDLMDNGFGLEQAEELLSQMKLAYNSRRLGETRQVVVPRLSPSCGEEELRLAIEAPLFSDSGLARKSWMRSDKRLESMLGVDSIKVSQAMKERLSQEQYENAVDIISRFQRMWKEQNGNSPSPFAPGRKTRPQRNAGRNEYHRGYIREPLVHIMVSDTFSALNNEQKAQVLFSLSSLQARKNWGKIRPRMRALDYLEKSFRGSQPTAEQVLQKLETYSKKHKGYMV